MSRLTRWYSLIMSDDLYTPLCLIGAGGHGKVVASFAKAQWQAPICFADTGLQTRTQILGLPVQYNEISEITGHRVIITIGINALREKLQNQAVAAGHGIATMVADCAVMMTDRSPGPGTMVIGGAVVNVDAQLGAGVIVNTNAVVEHDCLIGDFCHLAPGAVALGGSRLGARVWMGANATVLQGVQITADCIIGAGAVVTRDIATAGTYVGSPARRVEG